MSTAPHLSSALAAAFSARRVGVTLLLSALTALALSPIYVTTLPVLIGRALLAGLMALAAFGLFEQWPERLPRWLARWVLQVAGVVLAVPLGVLLAYLISTGGSLQAFWDNEARITGFLWMAFSGLVLAVLMAMSALVRQRDAAVQAQQLAFELERSELERQRAGRPPAPAAGPGRAALPLQHPGQCARAGGRRLAAGLAGAVQPDRLPARRRAAPAGAGNTAGPGAGAGARLPGADAPAHARPAAVQRRGRPRPCRRCAARP
jgi:hypothetical protein